MTSVSALAMDHGGGKSPTFPPRPSPGAPARQQAIVGVAAGGPPRLTTEDLFAAYHEFTVKACEIIAQSRTRDLMGEPVPCRKFALLVPEKFGCRSYLNASDQLFKNKISYTLEVKRVVEDPSGGNDTKKAAATPSKRRQRSSIMERWYFHFTPIDDEPPDDRRPESLRSKDETILRRMAVALRSLYPLTRILPAFTYFKEAGMTTPRSGASTPRRPEMQQRDCPRHRHLVTGEAATGEQHERAPTSSTGGGGSPVVKLQVSLWHYKPSSGEDDVTMVTPEHHVLTAEPRDLPNSPVGEICALGSSIGTLRIILHREREVHKSAYWKKKWSAAAAAAPVAQSPTGTPREGSSRSVSRASSADLTQTPVPLSDASGTKVSGGIVIDDAFFGGAATTANSRTAYHLSSASPRHNLQGIEGGDELQMVIEDQYGNKVDLPGELSGGEEEDLAEGVDHHRSTSPPSLYSIILCGSTANTLLWSDPYWRGHPDWLQQAADKLCDESREMSECLKDPLPSLRGVWADPSVVSSTPSSPVSSSSASAAGSSPCPCCGYVEEAVTNAADLDWPEVEAVAEASTSVETEDGDNGYWSDGYCESDYSAGEIPLAGIEPATSRRGSFSESSPCVPFGSPISVLMFGLDRNTQTVSAGLLVDSIRQAMRALPGSESEPHAVTDTRRPSRGITSR